MDIEKVKLEFKELVSIDLKKTLFSIEKKILQNSDSYDDLVILKSRFNKFTRDEIRGTINNSDREIAFNKITNSMLKFINQLCKSDFIENETQLAEIVKIKEFSLIKRSELIKKNKNKDNVNRGGKIQKVYDLFTVNLSSIELEELNKGKNEINTVGEEILNYNKKLEHLELGIFDELNLKYIGKNSRNIFFTKRGAKSLSKGKIKFLINELFKIMGVDDYGKGIFTEEDIINFKDLEFDILFGRGWREYPKNNPPIALTYESDEDILSLAIWGI